MSEWFLPRITDYWDWQTEAIVRNSERLGRLTEEDRIHALRSIQSAVTEHVRALSAELLLKVTVSLVDDLYKVANRLELWSRFHAQYLQSSAAAVLDGLHQRRYSVRYLVDNRFEGMERVFKLFPRMFVAAGLKYLAPANMALELMAGDGVAEDGFAENFPRYSLEAHHVADMAARQLNSVHASYVYLNTDDCEDPFATCVADAERALIVLREDAPDPGSTVTVRFPAAPLEP